MNPQPRFTLKAILGCNAALCVPLAMIAGGETHGLIYVSLIIGGCVGYLVKGWNGLVVGVGVGALVIGVIMAGACLSLWRISCDATRTIEVWVGIEIALSPSGYAM